MTLAGAKSSLSTLSREQSRQIDQRAVAELGLDSLVLMENAGRGVVDVLEHLKIHGPVLIACGGGNNGGDGLVVARHLEIRGHEPRVLVWASPAKLSPDARVNFEILLRSGVPISVLDDRPDAAALEAALAGCDWIVDALLGAGARGEPRPPLDQVIPALNATACRKLAIDFPSGLDVDTGQPARHTFRADHTCTMVRPKRGSQFAAAAPYIGQTHVVDIGVPARFVERILISLERPQP